MLSISRADGDEEGHIRVADLLSKRRAQSPILGVENPWSVASRHPMSNVSGLAVHRPFEIEPPLLEMYSHVMNVQSAQDRQTKIHQATSDKTYTVARSAPLHALWNPS